MSSSTLFRCQPFLTSSRNDKCFRTDGSSTRLTRSITRCCTNSSPMEEVERSVARVKEVFGKRAELSVSAYDTAWVAMVPSRDSPNKPYFPQCLDWIIQNQHQDGSWGLLPGHQLLVKDNLSCTMACLVALKKWGLGDQLVQRGLEFVRLNGSAATRTDMLSPIGFEIVFPNMVNEAINLGINMPLHQNSLDHMIRARDSVIQRHKGNAGVLAYVAEGLRESQPGIELINFQRSNGSILNSPATTAAALLHYPADDKYIEFLCSLLEEYESGVPTSHPMEMYTHLCMVDTLQRLGIERIFKQEVETVLDHAYRCSQLKSEELFLDVNCCAMAFRLLRQHGYEVSSDEFERFGNQEQFFDTVSMQYTNVNTILELFRASAWKVDQNESPLGKLHAWTSSYLKQQLLEKRIIDERLRKEVEFELRHINSAVNRIQSRQSIDLHTEDKLQMLKTSYRCSNSVNRDLHLISVHDFNKCQSIHRAEVQNIERWFKENNLNQITQSREVLLFPYFIFTAELFYPDLPDARLTMALIGTLTCLVDDLFDNCGSKEELLNIIDLTQRWEEPLASDTSSSQAEIFYSALWRTTNEIAAKASIKQGRCIKNDMIKLWLNLLNCMMKEMDWCTNEVTPTMDEYLSVASVSIALELAIFPAICNLGPELSKELFDSEEYKSLIKHTTIVGRLLNDLESYKKEIEEKKVNSVSILLHQGHGEVTMEEAVETIEGMIEDHKTELLKIVLETKGSRVPQICKDLIWSSNKILQFLNTYKDSPKEMMQHVQKTIYEPIDPPSYLG